MERVCFTFQIRPGTERAYERLHEEMDPAVRLVISQSGFRRYSLFRQGSTVIAYCECGPDAPSAFRALGNEPLNEEWNLRMNDIIAVKSDGSFIDRAAEIWHLD